MARRELGVPRPPTISKRSFVSFAESAARRDRPGRSVASREFCSAIAKFEKGPASVSSSFGSAVPLCFYRPGRDSCAANWCLAVTHFPRRGSGYNFIFKINRYVYRDKASVFIFVPGGFRTRVLKRSYTNRCGCYI